MKCQLLQIVWVGALLAFPAVGRQIVINEVMFHPPPNQPEDTALEWIELHNIGTNAVNLRGWRFSKGIDFTFTTDTVIGPGGYLVVAADTDAFQLRYPGVNNFVGGWNGTLANGGEEIELEEPGAVNHDSVVYADEGDWAVRRILPDPNAGLPSWEWTSAADGLGSSLELINPNLSNNSGQNWSASVTPNGTPGQANSVAAASVAPLILETQHFPAVPRSTDAVTITARLVDEQPGAVSVFLFYRPHTTQFPDEYNSLLMFDDGAHNDGAAGDGLYGTTIAPQPNGTVIEFYIQASDGLLTRTWPAETLDQSSVPSQGANALYQVDDSVYAGPQPIIRIIMTETERSRLQSINRQSDAQMNATFISIDGTDTKIRYNVGVRIRGAGSRGDPIPNYRVNIPKDRLWNGVSEVNLNQHWGYNQVVGSALLQKSGLVAADARGVQVRVNGVNLAGSAPRYSYGSYALLEVINGDWANHHLPNDSGGNIYRASIGSHTADLSYRGEDRQTYINFGYSRVSNISDTDWSDLFLLTSTLTSAPDATYTDSIRQVIDVESWMRYFALFTALTSMETSLANGEGDDFGLYRGLTDTRFIVLPHDLDTIFGQGDTGGNVNANLFRMCRFTSPAVDTYVMDRFMTNDVFVRIYYRELNRLMATTFSSAQLDPLFDQLLTGWMPPQTIDSMKQFAVARNTFIRSQIPTALSITTNLPIVNGYPQSATATFALGGRANPVETYSIRVNGALADFTPWLTTWSISGVTLNPGINRVLVQALGQSGEEIERAYIDVWYDRGGVTDTPAAIVADTVWTAANGPYRVSGNVGMNAGVSLTIQPGTTVYFDPGASLQVGGRILAAGTDTQRIRFTRTPGTSGTWGGVSLEDTHDSNHLAYIDFEYIGGNNLALFNSTLYVDHATWRNTTQTIIELNNSSLLVRDSDFPTLVGAEHIHGGPVPANGFVVIDGNTFGGTTGLNDIIDFTGARRPGPILQVLNNVFTSASDDVLDLDGTDAHIEGNVFLHVHKNNPNLGDTASAISYGQDAGYGPSVVAVRNIFYDVDHVALCKEGGQLTLANNTAVGISIAAVNFSEPERNTVPGVGALLEGNIFYNPDGYTGTNFKNLFPTNGTVQLALLRNLFSATDGVTNGVDGNLVGAPRLRNADTNSITMATIRDDFSLLPGSPGQDSGPNGLDMGANVPAGASISGEPPSPTSRTSATITVAGPGITHYRHSLNGGAFGAETPISTPIQLSGLANGSYTVRAIGKNSAGVWQLETNATVSRTWTVTPSAGGVRINEILARNDTAVPVGNEFPDLVELQNTAAAPANLSGMGLTDDPAEPFKFKFPAGSTINPGGFLVAFADNEKTPAGTHFGFGLDQNGDALYLYTASGVLVDSVTFGLQLADLSVGRLQDGSWALTQPTFGAANAAYSLGDPRGLKINEWLADGGTLFANDFVELFNADSLPVALGGFLFSDTPQGAPARHRIAALSFINGGAHLAFIADGDLTQGAEHLGFHLSPEQGQIALFTPETNLIDCIWYGPQTTDVSEGRRPSGAETFSFFGPPTQTQPTPGGPNPGAGGITIITNITVPLLPMLTTWTYEASGAGLDGTGWEQPGFDDSLWPLGTALLAVENCGCLPFPINAGFAPYNNNQIPYYFRTKFIVNTNLSGYDLTLSTVLDDGAVIYLNGQELLRVRMPPGPISAFTQAEAPSVNNATLETFTLPGINIPMGTNVLAVEVHQAAIPSSDITWGMALDASRLSTNSTTLSVVLNEVMANNVTVTNLGSTNVTDWVELYNAGINTVNLSGMSLTDDTAVPRRWVFPPGTTIASGGYLVVQFDSSSPASTTGGGSLNTGFGLGANGDEVYLFDTLPRGGALLDGVTFGVQAADFSIALVPGGSGSWRLAVPSQGTANIAANLGNVSSVRINEWMANPSGNDDDYLELFNPNPQPVNISGLYLTDNFGVPLKHKIAQLSFIGAGVDGFVRFIADNNVDNGPDHVGFGLGAGGEVIGFFTGAGVAIDTVTFGAQANGVSEGRFPDGSTNIVRFPGTPSPARPNILPLLDVVVSEVLTHTDPPFEDAIELRNISASSVDVSGWYLTDSRNEPKRFRIPTGTIIPAGGFVVFYEYQFNPDFTGRAPFFSLSSVNGDEVYLYTADAAGNLTGYRSGVEFGPQANAVPFGRHATSQGHDFTALSARTFGADNPTDVGQFRTGTGLPNAYPLVGPIVISEIMYHPPDVGTNDNALDEFIELQNISASAVPLFDTNSPPNTWRLRDAVDFDFPANVTIPGGGFLIVVGFDPATNAAMTDAFRIKYDIGTFDPILGPWQGKLDNSSENVELYKPDPPQPPGSANAGFVPYVQADKVKYADTAPWPVLADGATAGGVGYSLHRRVASNYGNDPVNWFAAPPSPELPSATPPLALPSIASITAPHALPIGSNDTLTVVAAGAPVLTYQWSFNGVAIAGATNTSLTLNNFQPANAGDYSVTVANAAGSTVAFTRVNLHSAPIVVRPPQDLAVAFGGDAFFNVVAGGTPPLSYQWLFNDEVLIGLTNSSLRITGVFEDNEGLYRVVITNVFGAVTSAPAILGIFAPPQITAQPRSTNVFVSTTVAFSVSVSGSPPLRYQWSLNNVNIPGATNAMLTLTNVQVAAGGDYRVFVTNTVGTVLSAAATLTVTVPPFVTIVATDASASEPGANAGLFTVSRTGGTGSPLAVSFNVSGNAVPGSDYTALVSPVTIPAGAGSTTISVTALNDAALEGNESVIVTLTGGATYAVGTPGSATVIITDDDNLPPSVVVTNPVAGAVFNLPATIILGASAADFDGSVAKVEFYSNATNKLGEDLSAPFTVLWTNGTAGTHLITAVATDNLGSTAISSPVTMILNAGPTVTLTSPTNNTQFGAPAIIVITATATDADGSVSQVDFYSGTDFLGSDTSSPYSVTWTNVPVGGYLLSARAIDNRGAVTVSANVSITVIVPPPGFADAFVARGQFTGFTNFLRGNSSTFTREPGEPRHEDRSGTRSGWVSWTAPASGICTLDTFNSGFDTVLSIYTGDLVSSLFKVAGNDDATPNTLQSRVTFSATAGTRYEIAVDGYSAGLGGAIEFHLNLPNPFPIITSQPQSFLVDPGANVVFNVGAGGSGPFTYQWRFNGTNVAGATLPSLTRNNVQTADQGSYAVIVSNASGSVTSAPASLTLRLPPTIVSQPQNVTADPGGSATFSVGAVGLTPFAYQWSFNGSLIAGATNGSYTRSALQYADAGLFTVVVTNILGSAPSQAAELIIKPSIANLQFSNGIFQFTVRAMANRPHAVDVSTNLVNWIPMRTNTSATLDTIVNDPAAGSPWRFYRSRLVQ